MNYIMNIHDHIDQNSLFVIWMPTVWVAAHRLFYPDSSFRVGCSNNLFPFAVHTYNQYR
jgi:hypothetical protein